MTTASQRSVILPYEEAIRFGATFLSMESPAVLLVAQGELFDLRSPERCFYAGYEGDLCESFFPTMRLRCGQWQERDGCNKWRDVNYRPSTAQVPVRAIEVSDEIRGAVRDHGWPEHLVAGLAAGFSLAEARSMADASIELLRLGDGLPFAAYCPNYSNVSVSKAAIVSISTANADLARRKADLASVWEQRALEAATLEKTHPEFFRAPKSSK